MIPYIKPSWWQKESATLETQTGKLNKRKTENQKNENLKSLIINSLSQGHDKAAISLKIRKDFDKIINEINENSNIQIITQNKTDEKVSVLLGELIQDHKAQSNLKKIESLEQKLINNLDENSYSELIKLKSQLNGE